MAACAPALRSFFKHVLINPTAKLVRRAKSPAEDVSGDSDNQQVGERIRVYNGNRDSKAPDVHHIGNAV
jgi:hypothetical protein